MRNFRAVLGLFMLIPGWVAAEEFDDPDYGFSFTVDESQWKPAPIPVRTLGEPLIVLVDGPNPTALVDAFVRTSPKPAKSVDDALQGSADNLKRLAAAIPGGKTLQNQVVDIANTKALSFRMSGQGSGIGLGQGDVPTTQHWFAFARGRDLIVLQLTAPSTNFDSAYAKFEPIVKTIDIQPQRPKPPASRKFASDDIGVSIDYPQAPWIRGGYELGDFGVPGFLLRLWSAPSQVGKTEDGESNYANRLAMFLQFPGQKISCQTLLDISVQGLQNAYSVDVIEQDVREIAGMQAMWLVVEGNSPSGAALTGQGDVRTRQLWVAIPRTHGTLENIVVFLLNSPSGDYDESVKEVQRMFKTLKIEGTGE